MAMFQPAVATRLGQTQKQVSQPFNIPSPTGGINARDSFTQMPPSDAINLINVFPEANTSVVRKGFSRWAQGLANDVETLLVWNGPSTDKLFGAAGPAIFNVTASGTVGPPDVTGLTNARWQWTNIETAGGMFLVACNGADAVRNYDGTTWTTPTITGVDSTTFINVTQFKERLWFAANNSLTLYYLDLKAIAGAATAFPLGAVFRRGGYVVGLGSFSNDAGEGPDDYFVIVSNQGEVVVYQGTDPSSATTWSLVGIFQMGKPIGRRCLARLSGDLAVITQDGVISLQAALQFDRSAGDKAAITAKIQTLFSQQSALYFSNFGWQPLVYPRARYLIVNVPQIPDEVAIQLVMNTVTGSWTQFQGMSAECWATANDLLYFGASNGLVYQADDGYLDDVTGNLTFINDSGGILQFQNNLGQDIFFTVTTQAPIQWEIQTSWQAVWSQANKLFTAIRPVMLTGGGVQFAIDVDVDFVTQPPTGLLPTAPLQGMIWPFIWPGTWGGQNMFDARWHSVGKIGTYSSIHLIGTVNGAACEINNFDLVSQLGGIY